MNTFIEKHTFLILFPLQVVEQGTELATKQAMKRMNSVSAKSSPYLETKKVR